MNSTSELCGGGRGRYEGVGRGKSYLLILILVSIVPKHSDELHIRTVWGRMGEILCGGGWGRYEGGGERASLPVDFDPCQDCAKTL